MAEFTAGEVVVPVVPSAQNFIKELKKQVIAGAYPLGQEIGREIQRGISDNLKGVFEPLKEQTQKQKRQAPKDGAAVGGAFAQGFKKQIETAFKSLPKAEIDADADPAQRKVQEIRAALAALSQGTIGVDIDAKDALAQMAELQAQLQELNQNGTVDVKADTAAALAALAKVQAAVEKIDGQEPTIQPKIEPKGDPAKEGERQGGAYAQAFKSRVEAAFKALPELTIDANSAPAAQKIAELRARMEALSSKTVGIDIDAGSARAELAAIEAELQAIDGQNLAIDVRTDVAAALGELAAVEAEASRLDGRTVNARVDVDVAGALTSIATVTGALAAIPIAASAALGAGALGGLFATVGLGVAGVAAVAVPSLTRINDSLKAQESAANSAARGVGAATGAVKNLAIEQAQVQIQTLQAANAADQLRNAQDRVKEAISGVSDAQARLKSAVQAASAAQAAAAQRAAAAERSLADAQRSALQAQEALNKARQQAIKDLEGVTRSLKGNALDQRQAALDVTDAQNELNKAQAGGNADAIERASIAYERAKLRVEELRAEQERLNTEQAKGVENNDNVVAAKSAVESANARVLDQERLLAQAYADAGKAGEAAAKRVADAEKAVADARKKVNDAKAAVERVKRDQKIAALQEKIRKEQAKQQAKAVSAPQAAATQKTSALSPAEQSAAASIKAFQDSYKKFQQDLGSSVLPVITGGLKIIGGLFKPLTPLIKGTSGALVGLEKDAQKSLQGPFWKDFFDQISKQAPGAVTGLGKAFGSIGVGVAGVIKAFLPFVPTIVGGIQKAASAFATWGKGLGKSQAFKDFIAYAKANLPAIINLIKNAATTGVNLVKGLAPLGAGVLGGLSALVGLLAKLPPGVLAAIATAIGGVVLGVKAWGIAQKILNVALSSNPIGLIISAIGLLVAGLIYAYQNSETFRNIVNAVFQAVGAAATWLWENVLKPVFDALVLLWQNVVGPAVTWLWTTIIKPAFEGIGVIIKFAWESIIKPAFTAVHDFLVNTLGPKVLWFQKTIVEPVFKAVGAAIKFAWDTVIKPAFTAVNDFLLNTLGPKVLWFQKTIVEPVFKAVGEAIAFAWDKVIKPAFSALWTFITETIPNGFKSGVALIGKFWDGLRELAKAPVNFVIETVYNNGIVTLWNTVADALGLSAKLTKIPKLATGGILPGYTPGRDVGIAAVSGGEAVMRPEWTRAVGSDFVNSANKAASSGGVSGAAGFMSDRFAGGFASGGIIGDVVAKGVQWGADNILNPILDQAAKVMGTSKFGQMLLSWPKKMVADVVKYLTGKEAAQGGPGAAKAIQYAQSQIGKPYEWGATGPASFDCSGLTMRAWQAGGRTDIPRTSQEQMGWVKKIAKPVPGALGFPNSGHVWLYTGPNSIIESPQTGKNVQAVAARAAQVVGLPPATFDSGGYLPTGHSLVYNGTGSPEPVLTDQQWQSMQGGTRGGDSGPMLNIDQFNATPEQSPQAIARELYWLSKARPR